MEEMRKIEEDPASRSAPGEFFIYNAKARKKLDRIREDITHNMAMKRAVTGNPVSCDGYSGRKQNRR